MRLEAITDLERLAHLREHWDAVHAADDQAGFFLSWSWMFKRLEKLGSSWIVLAARPEAGSARCVAFLPLRVRKVQRGERIVVKLAMAGTSLADYTGPLCLPDFESTALPALGEALKVLRTKLKCSQVHLENLRASDNRLRLLLNQFPRSLFKVEITSSMTPDGIDNAVCPWIDLPDSWNEYLGKCVSANTRQKLKRLLRQVEDSSEYGFTCSTADTMEDELRRMLSLWETKWGARKAGRIEQIRRQTLSMLMDCHAVGSLRLPRLQRNGQTVCALALLLDHQSKSCLFYMAGRDMTIGLPSPGLALHAFSIRQAIADGFRTYDFMRGNESYKFHFTSAVIRLCSVMISPRPETISSSSVASHEVLAPVI